MKESQRIKPIIPFTKEHIPEVKDLFCRLLLKDSSSLRLQPESVLNEYFSNIFFHNPWYDEDTPSWVYRGQDGRIIGFLGVVPRRMTFQGQPLRAAVSFHFMVDPESRSSLAGVQLLKHFFSGPQDLAITDGAGEVGRIVWEGVGGKTAWLYSLFWTKILQPARNSIRLIENRSFLRPLALAAGPFCKLADLAASRLAPHIFSPLVDTSREQELDIDSLIGNARLFAGKRTVLPEYEAGSLKWLFSQLEQMRYYGELKKVLVHDSKGDVLGSFIYYLQPGGTSTVIQFLARKNGVPQMLDHLFSHAVRNGSIALHGRLDPRMMQEFSDKRCYFNRNGSWVLVHSREHGIIDAFQSGDAFLTGLEGEFGLLF